MAQFRRLSLPQSPAHVGTELHIRNEINRGYFWEHLNSREKTFQLVLGLQALE